MMGICRGIFPRNASSSTVFRSNWNLDVWIFVEGGKPENPEKNRPEQGREPTTNKIHTGVKYWPWATVTEQLRSVVDD